MRHRRVEGGYRGLLGRGRRGSEATLFEGTGMSTDRSSDRGGRSHGGIFQQVSGASRQIRRGRQTLAPRNRNVGCPMESNIATSLRNDPIGTPECEPLLNIAAPDVYRKNSFRVLGLPVDTSPREAAKEVNRRQMLAELGQTESGERSRLEIRPTPTVDDLRAAEA